MNLQCEGLFSMSFAPAKFYLPSSLALGATLLRGRWEAVEAESTPPRAASLHVVSLQGQPESVRKRRSVCDNTWGRLGFTGTEMKAQRIWHRTYCAEIFCGRRDRMKTTCGAAYMVQWP